MSTSLAERPQGPSELDAARAMLAWFRGGNGNATTFDKKWFARVIDEGGHVGISGYYDQVSAGLSGEDVVNILLASGDLEEVKFVSDGFTYLRVVQQ